MGQLNFGTALVHPQQLGWLCNIIIVVHLWCQYGITKLVHTCLRVIIWVIKPARALTPNGCSNRNGTLETAWPASLNNWTTFNKERICFGFKMGWLIHHLIYHFNRNSDWWHTRPILLRITNSTRTTITMTTVAEIEPTSQFLSSSELGPSFSS